MFLARQPDKQQMYVCPMATEAKVDGRMVKVTYAERLRTGWRWVPKRIGTAGGWSVIAPTEAQARLMIQKLRGDDNG
jgi:hypothetical protein